MVKHEMNEQQNNQPQSMRRKVFSGLFWKFGERITAQVISLIVSIVLARLLTPHDYGAVSLVMIFITIANVFVSGGFGNSLIQKKNADNLDFSSVFFISIGIGTTLYVLLFAAAPLIASFYGLPILTPVLRVLGIRIIVASINSVQHAYVFRHMLFKRFFWSTLFGTLLSGVVGIAMAYHGFGVWSLVAQYLTNTCTDTIVLWFTVRWRPDFRCSWTRAKGLLSYGWKLLASSLLDTGYKQLRSLIIGKKYTVSDMTYYNQGDKLPSLIVTNINTTIGHVLFPAMSQVQDDRPRIKQMTRRAIQISSYIMWPLMIGFAIVAEPFVSLVLTDKWLPCVPFIRIFCLSYGLYPIQTANLQAINAIGRSDLSLRLEIIKKVIGFVMILLTMNFGTLVIAYGLLVTDVIATFVNVLPNRRLLNYNYFEQFRDLLPGLLMSVVMGAVIYPIGGLGLPDGATIALQVVCGAAVYLLESVLTRQTAFQYLVGFLRKS